MAIKMIPPKSKLYEILFGRYLNISISIPFGLKYEEILDFNVGLDETFDDFNILICPLCLRFILAIDLF